MLLETTADVTGAVTADIGGVGALEERLTSTLLDLSTVISTKQQELKEQTQQWESQWAVMQRYVASAPNKIKLDVGGQPFHASKSVLLRWDCTFFYGMLATNKWQLDQDGAYFIDRDPLVFDRILACLRSGDPVDMRGLGEREREILEQDLAFYEIPRDRWTIQVALGSPNGGEIHKLESANGKREVKEVALPTVKTHAVAHRKEEKGDLFDIGDPVILHGLNKAELNGKFGRVSGYIESSNRFEVRLTGDGDVKAFLPTNLKLANADSGPELSDDKKTRRNSNPFDDDIKKTINSKSPFDDD